MDTAQKELQNIKILSSFFHVLVPHAKQFSQVDSPAFEQALHMMLMREATD